jgi:hypothetical protein
LPGLSADEAAYYAAQPLWFVAVTDIALAGAILAALALLLRSKAAVWLFALSLLAILVANGYDLAAGTSRALVSQGAMAATCVIVVLAVLELLYAWAMKTRGVLR